jgi:transcriptional regulator with XRE-family HTH domain
MSSYKAAAIVIGSNLKKVREEHELTQKELGRLIFLDQRSISAFENGDRVPNGATLWMLALRLGCSVDVFFG